MTNDSPKHSPFLQRLWWNLVYLVRKTPWDTGITPPEVRAAVEGGQVGPGRALDLGCGTGTNVIYLAQHGFETTGIDISSRAIAKAERKIKQARLNGRVQVYVGDVAQLDALPVAGLFELALDIGCLHVVEPSARPHYAQGVTRRLRPGGLYLLYAFGPRTTWARRMGITSEQIAQLFTPTLSILQVNHGQDQGGIASAWYTLQKASSP